MLRNEDGTNITASHINALAQWDPSKEPDTEIQFTPARVVMQDFTGVPCVVDLAAMREAMAELGGDPKKINPLVPTELVIDHSVIIDVFGAPDAFEKNRAIEDRRNEDRFHFIEWTKRAFKNMEVIPPGNGIMHQLDQIRTDIVVIMSGADEMAAAAVPFNQYGVPPEATTDANGNATLAMNQESGFPAARKQQLLVMFVRARAPGAAITGGISDRLLVSFPVSLK